MSVFANSEAEMTFPCHFPVKVVGKACDEFELSVVAIAQAYDPEFSTDIHVKRHESRTGKYQSLTLDMHATSREQLDAIYHDLKNCEWVLWAI